MSIKEEMIEKYRVALGCKNTGVCWCSKCATIERIVNDVIKLVKRNLDSL
jgi:hypothetical protein